MVTVVFPHTVGDEKRLSTATLSTRRTVALAHAPRVKNVIVHHLILAEPGYLILAEGRVISHARINEDVLEDLQESLGQNRRLLFQENSTIIGKAKTVDIISI